MLRRWKLLIVTGVGAALLLMLLGCGVFERPYSDERVAKFLLEAGGFGHDSVQSILDAELEIRRPVNSYIIELTLLTGPALKKSGEREWVQIHVSPCGNINEVIHHTVES